MLKRVNRFIYLFVGFIFMFLSINEIDAATIQTGPKLYYYTRVGTDYGLYYGSSGSVDSTKANIYKTIDGEEAICVQADTYSPKTGDNYEEVAWGETIQGRTWNSTQAIMSGILMELVSHKYYDYDAYCFKYVTLNSYLGFNKSENFSVYNPLIAEFIDEAYVLYDAYAFDDELPSFGASTVKTVMDMYNTGGSTYYVGSFKLSNLIQSFGSTPVKYDITLPSNVKLYTDAALTNEASTSYEATLSGDKVFYVKYTGGDVGGQVQIRVTASSSRIYSYARLWKPVDSNSNAQLVVTQQAATLTRTPRTRTVTFEIPDVNNKTIKLVKKDAGSGENLIGSTMKLQLSGGSTSACTIQDGNYSCSISIPETLTGDTYYSVIETTAPDGYILGNTIENVKWDINATGDVCYSSTANGLAATDNNDCDRTYQVNTVCTTEDGVTKEGQCATIVDPSLPEDTPEEDKTYITVGTEEKVCYYVTGDVVEKVDDSKCNTQYVKVTNSSGNLVVEYYNAKNHVEISKYAVNGENELVGAELKICSTKPNAKGECTIVRNTVAGQCSNGTLSTEYNCVNNNDNTKTIDMHWISGLSSKIWYGIPKGTYYLVETVAPSGYLPISTYVEFTVDENGKVTSSSYDEGMKKIIVRNKPTNFKVVKKAAATGKNLAGATLSICSAFKDQDGKYHLDVGNDGYCFPAILSDGQPATWVTTDKVKTISGLGVGTYYLVELSAPENYSIADAIFFAVNEDGTITDQDGKAITDNKLVMTDVEITNQKTGELPILMIVLVGVSACGLSYYYLVKKKGLDILRDKFNKN